MSVFFTSTDLFDPEEAQKRIQGILGSFPDMFALEHIGDLRIPPGWVDILVMALKDAAANDAELQIRKLFVKSGSPFVEFVSGTEVDKKLFQAALQQAKEYCPCCGTLWAEARQYEHGRDG